MEEYTVLLRDLIEEEDIPLEDLKDMLNNDNEDFMSFKDLLKREIQLKTNSLDEKETLKKCFKEKEIYFNRNTLENWFHDKTPKKSDESREHMYKVAFALDLNIEETKRLFRKVYKDRPFNIRRINEFVYYICIANQYDYHYAQEIIEEAKQFDFMDTNIESTRQLANDIQFINTKESILEYIKNHYSSFCTNNISAKRVLRTLIQDIIVKEDEKEFIKKNQINEKNSILAQELACRPELFKPNHSMTSISGMLTFIYNKDYYSEVSKEDFGEIGFPKEIITNMPTKHTFSKKDPSYEELRKMILLLASYKFWIISEFSKISYDLDDYIYEINGYLLDANLPELYPGNPFDWLFLWCSYNDNPLKTFRQIFNNM